MLPTHASNKHEWQNHVFVLQGTWPCQGVDIPGRWWNRAEPALMVETLTHSGSEVEASLVGQSWVMGGPLHLSTKSLPLSLFPVPCSVDWILTSVLALAHWVGDKVRVHSWRSTESRLSTRADKGLTQPSCLMWPSTEPPSRGKTYLEMSWPCSGLSGLICKVRTHLDYRMGPQMPQTPSPISFFPF